VVFLSVTKEGTRVQKSTFFQRACLSALAVLMKNFSTIDVKVMEMIDFDSKPDQRQRQQH
jgi:hypothetical protein